MRALSRTRLLATAILLLATAAPASAQPTPPPAPDPVPQDDGAYGAKARVSRPPAREQRFGEEELRSLPGAFGDPFRMVDALPGVVPAFSGLPYVYVRGAPPAGTVYYYDGIQVPALFHLALGPAVVHPAMIGAVDFYASVAPARYGRYTGGVLAGGALAGERGARGRGELELRLIDTMAFVETPVGGGTVSVAGRYGYPGLILSLLSPDAVLAYWDYQSRIDLPLSARARLQLLWFGSFDRAGDETDTSTFQFHRVELRLLREVGRLQLGSAMQVGYDESTIESSFGVRALRVQPRVFAQWSGEDGVRARAGADLTGSAGKLRNMQADDTVSFDLATPLYASVAAREAFGLYGELLLPVAERVSLEPGLRGDLWLAGSSADAAVDPRLTLRVRSHKAVSWHVAAGLAHQPAVFLLPLPGIADVALDHGLQEAVQSEAGVAVVLGAGTSLQAQGYLQRFSNMILPDLVLDLSETCDSLPPDTARLVMPCRAGYPRASVWAYGLEAFLRRSEREVFSGWLNYTLGFADGEAEDGTPFTPSFDVRHVGNLVLRYRISQGLHAGTRLHYRSGKMASTTFQRAVPVRYEQRLPGFFRADVELSYAWSTSWGRLRVSAEWLNLTMSREATDIECHDGIDVGSDPRGATPCEVKLAPAIFFPNAGVRAEL